MKYHYLAPLILISACGGNSSSNDANALLGGLDASSNGGCEQEFYQTIIGNYSGTVDLIENVGDAPRVCSWQSTVSITGESILSTCQLRAITIGIVTQSTFYPDDGFARYQCLDDQGQHTVSEPIGDNILSAEFPDLDNSFFPVDISFSGNPDAPFVGPTFGNENLIGRYVYLYDGIQSNIVGNITVDGFNSLTLRRRNGDTLGTLTKE